MPDPQQHPDLPFSRQLIIATAGHVDHGKTSVIKHLTGTDTDTLKEEQARGLTINPGFAYHHFTASNHTDSGRAGTDDPGVHYTLGFVDVPGHADFIHNMLAGVGSVQQAMLVVACDDGVMPQTREHLAILQLSGIDKLTVVLSKTDRVAEGQIETVREDIAALLSSHDLVSTGCFPVNNVSGQGVPELQTHLESLMLASTGKPDAIHDFCTRFLIDRSFSVKGIGTVVTGTLKTGRISVENQLLLSSTGEEARVRGLQLDDRTLRQINPGQRAALNITADHDRITRGDWLLASASYAPCLRMDVELKLLDTDQFLKPGTQYHMYLGASHHVVNLRLLDQANAIYQLRSQDALHAHHGDRFVLRDPAASSTIGGGKVIDILVPRKGRTGAARIASLRAMKQSAEQALPQLLAQNKMGVDLQQFITNYDLTDAATQKLLTESSDVTQITVKGRPRPWLFQNSALGKLGEEILQQLQTFHVTNKNLQGISEPKLNQKLSFQGSPIVLSSFVLSGILDHLVEQGSIRRTGTLLHLPDHRASLSKEEEEFLARVHPVLREAGRVPPRTRELVELTDLPLKALERILRQCTRAGMLVQVAENRHYLPETIAELAEFTEKLADKSDDESGFSVIQFRDASGIGRNLCIEILEYFDRIGFTRREDNTRFLRTQKENIFG